MNFRRRIEIAIEIRSSLKTEIGLMTEEIRRNNHLIAKLQCSTSRELYKTNKNFANTNSSAADMQARQLLSRDLVKLADAQVRNHDLYLQLSRFRAERRKVLWRMVFRPPGSD